MAARPGRWAALTDAFRRRRAPHLFIQTDTGTGPVVILVHGIASTAVTFRKVVPMLAPGHRVIAVDILGHGPRRHRRTASTPSTTMSRRSPRPSGR